MRIRIRRPGLSLLVDKGLAGWQRGRSMPDIHYVCISDTHFGADNSLLTNLGSGTGEVDPYRPSEVLLRFVECLRALISRNTGGARPTLVLNGDIFEFALRPDNFAAMAFQRFVELTM